MKKFFRIRVVKYNRLLTLILIFSIISTILSVLFTYSLINSLSLVTNEQNKRIESLLLADELKQSSNDLTKFARMYVETGHPRYKYYYDIVIKIRDGSIKKPDDYDSFFWEINTSNIWQINKQSIIDTVFESGGISFRDRMKELKFTKKEFDLLSKSEKLSTNLSLTEKEAFDIIESYKWKVLIDDNPLSKTFGEYIYENELIIDDTIKGMDIVYSDPFTGNLILKRSSLKEQSDITYAKGLLFHPDYLKKKSEIMCPIDQFKKEVDNRTQDSLDMYKKDAESYMLYTIVLSIISLGFLFTLSFIIFKTKRKNDNLLFTLNKKNTYLEHAAKILRHDMHSGINLYMPRGLKSLDRRITNKQMEDLKIDGSIKMIREGLKHTQKVYKGVYEFTNLVKKDVVMSKEICNIKEILKDYLSSTSYINLVHLDDSLPDIEVNQSLFCTAVDNLIRNGLKYNDSDPKLVKVYYEDGFICVEDNGRGITQEEFKYLSEPYTRREGQVEQGMGLGLNICNSILEEHKFTILVEKLKNGSRIKINTKC
jgi:hypothetical protein